LVVTEGFRDLLVIQRLRIPGASGWTSGRPEPLIPREHVLEVTERMRADGTTFIPIDEASIEKAAKSAQKLGLDGLVVCLMHSYRNPMHEVQVRDALQRVAPELD